MGPHGDVEFLLCGSPNDAFFSQIAFFRMSVDHLYGDNHRPRVVAVFGDAEVHELPERWQPYFIDIDVVHATPEQFREKGFYAANDLRFEHVNPDATLSCLCDADTALLRRVPTSLLAETRRNPAILGTIAHHRLTFAGDSALSSRPDGLVRGTRTDDAWRRLSMLTLGHEIDLDYRHTLPENPLRFVKRDRTGRGWFFFDRSVWPRRGRCPFYVNYGFVAGPPAMMGRLHELLMELHPKVESIVGNAFYGQASIPLATEHGGLATRALPMRYNYPNDRRVDRRYREELENVVLMHYLRTKEFDRHQVFATEQGFSEFLAMQLRGSDLVFQRHVRAVTDGRYPFPSHTA